MRSRCFSNILKLIARNMYIVAKIFIILVSHCILAKATKSLTKSSTVSRDFPPRLYLPTSQNREPKNRARTSDIEAVLENDLQVIPLAADHDQRNGFQYQPIISRQYSRGFTESPRYSQSAVPNLPHPLLLPPPLPLPLALPETRNTRRLGSPISNKNEVKPITKSQLSRDAVSCSSKPEGNNPSEYIKQVSFWCLRRFQTPHETHLLDKVPGADLTRRKILTVNDQADNVQPEGRPPPQLTPPSDNGISRISGHRIDKISLQTLLTKSISSNDPSRSKQTILIGQPSDHDVKPVFENNEYAINYDNYNGGNYQLGNHNTAAFTAGYSSNGNFKQSETTCSYILRQFLLQSDHRGYNYGYNTYQHLPTNPIIALILSHYGKYITGLREPRVYSYMAVNNIHNNKPFGSYKLTRDDDASFSP